MAKTLKNILEVAKPVSPADKEFVAKHIIKKTPDANKNGDDVFNATNTKVHKRSPNHGYDAGADEKAYDIKCSNTAAGVVCPVHGDTKCPGYMKESARSLSDILEKTLTPNEKSKREEIAMAIKRENPSMPIGKKMAIATAQAKKVAEETDLGEAKAATLSALTGKASPIDNYADMIAKFKAKGGGVTKVAAEVPDDKKTASLSATFGKGGGKGGSALATGEFASMNKKDAAYNAKQALARRKSSGMKIEETDIDEAALKYAQVDPKDVKKVLAAHRDTGETARHMGDGKIAYSGKKLMTSQNESYEELDEAVAKDHYDTHHKRAMSALNDIGKHLMKQKAMCDKSDNKWAHQDNAWAMKDMSRQLEDMMQNSAQRTENMMPMPAPKDSIRGY